MDTRIPVSRIACQCALLVSMVLASPAPAGAAEQRYDFDVSLGKRPIGTHRFIIRKSDDGAARVQSLASFEVRLLGIPAYRYRHQAEESWNGTCLAAIDATTDDNGRNIRVSGQQRDGRFHLQLPASTALPACLSAYAYWDRDLLLRQRELLNPQTGKLDAVRVESLGVEFVELGGRSVTAERYRLHAQNYLIDLWYSPGGDWLQLESIAGSRRITYRLKTDPVRQG
jgi:hypothetical protein